MSCCLVGPHDLPDAPVDIALRPTGGTILEPTILNPSTDAWGEAVAADATRLSLLKLKLLHSDTLRGANAAYPDRIATVMAELDKIETAGMSGPEALGRYIRLLCESASHNLEKYLANLGLQFNQVSIRFVFGISAVWGNDTVERMRDAVSKSDVLAARGSRPATVDFIAEPEATALALLPQIASSHTLKVLARSFPGLLSPVSVPKSFFFSASAMPPGAPSLIRL